jgi:hypothetical protein
MDREIRHPGQIVVHFQGNRSLMENAEAKKPWVRKVRLVDPLLIWGAVKRWLFVVVPCGERA